MHRLAFVVVVSAALGLTGCGYVGPVVPPSPKIPGPVNNLLAVERGDQIVITFSTPPRTTDFLPVQDFSNIDLRVGTNAEPFNEGRWVATARAYPIAPQDTGGDEAEPVSLPITKSIPAAEWQGKTIDVLVRTEIKKRGHFSNWSNRATLKVVLPLAPPALTVEATAAGYRLTWTADNRANKFQILRQVQGEKSPAVVGISEGREDNVEATAEWEKTYSYNVVAQVGAAESLPSPAVRINKPDTFAPAVPTGIVALAAPDSVELSWKRNEESDFKGYALFRSTDGGAFARQGDLLTLPSYTDRAVQHGKHYRYAISAVDQKGNASENSAAVEVAY